MIGIELKGEDRFNLTLTTKGSDAPFLTVKNCRVKMGQKGAFVSWPAFKGNDGKWVSHCYGTEPFVQSVVSAYNKAKAESAPPPPKRQKLEDMPDDVPF